MKRALVIGSLNMDMTVKVEELPKLGETIFGDDFYERLEQEVALKNEEKSARIGF